MLLGGGIFKMVKRREMSLTARQKELIKLIEDAKKLKFNENLIIDYKKQLKEIENTIKKDNVKRKKLRERLKNG